MPLTLMYITNNPYVASVADSCGVDRIWIDLETLGKEVRQRGMDSVKSHHSISDIVKVKSVLKNSDMLVRTNPINNDSACEIEKIINNGADYVMLPMWKSLYDVKRFIECVGGRAKTVLLLETKEAVECLDEVLDYGGFDEIHIGLNDLHLSYGLTFMFELLSSGVVEKLCKKINKYSIPYGFGGIARLGGGMISAEKIVAEHYRLGSTRAILSRSFCNAENIGSHSELVDTFERGMTELRMFERSLSEYDETRFLKNKSELDECVKKVVESIKRVKADAV